LRNRSEDRPVEDPSKIEATRLFRRYLGLLVAVEPARGGSLADEAFRDDMAKAAAPYGQPERRPNADH
jgi:hypothetical protein